MGMRLLGARNLKEVVREMVDASSIHQHIVAVPEDRLYHTNCKYIPNLSLCALLILFYHNRREHAICSSQGAEGQPVMIFRTMHHWNSGRLR